MSSTPFRFLISAGPTREFLDPIRYISNRSSGKMGFALAEAAGQDKAAKRRKVQPHSLGRNNRMLWCLRQGFRQATGTSQ